MEKNTTKPNLSILNLALGSAGAEKVISLLLKKLIKDYNVTLFLIFKERHFHIPKEVNVVSFTDRPSTSPMLVKIACGVLILFKYNRLLKKLNINYALSFLPFPNILNSISSIFHPGIKFLISERGFPSNNTSKKISHYISKVSYPLFYNRCDKLFSNSIYINQDLKENFGIKIPMDVIYNPIELPEKVIDSSTLSETKKRLNVITVGSLIPRKNQISIIDALEGSNDDYTLNIIGEGPLRPVLTERIAELELQNNAFLLGGGIKNVNDFLVESDCFVLSSRTEGFPNALLEALAAGLPSISANCLSGPQELLNDNLPTKIEKGGFLVGKYGILVNVDDSEGISSALAYLKENPEERERLGKLSIERSKQYELDNIYSIFNQFVQS